MRETPKASSTKLYRKLCSGRGNTPGYGKNDDDDKLTQKSYILKWAIRREAPKVDKVMTMDNSQRLPSSGFEKY